MPSSQTIAARCRNWRRVSKICRSNGGHWNARKGKIGSAWKPRSARPAIDTNATLPIGKAIEFAPARGKQWGKNMARDAFAKGSYADAMSAIRMHGC